MVQPSANRLLVESQRGAANGIASLDAGGKVPAGQVPVAYAPANPTLTVTYNADGSVASTIEDGVTTTFTYNTDGTVKTQTRAGVTKTFTYNAAGNVTGAA
jgi:YD repeat-containing protein